MSQKIAEELLPRLRLRSTGRGRKGRSLLIDELCEQWGYSLKHAIKLLGAKTVGAATPPCAKGVRPNTTARWRRCCGGFGRCTSSRVAKGSGRCCPSGFHTTKANTDGLGKNSAAAFCRLARLRSTGCWRRARPESATGAAAGPSPEGFSKRRSRSRRTPGTSPGQGILRRFYPLKTSKRRNFLPDLDLFERRHARSSLMT